MVYIDKVNLETRVSGSAYVTTELGTLLKYTVRHRCDTTIVRENVFKKYSLPYITCILCLLIAHVVHRNEHTSQL